MQKAHFSGSSRSKCKIDFLQLKFKMDVCNFCCLRWELNVVFVRLLYGRFLKSVLQFMVQILIILTMGVNSKFLFLRFFNVQNDDLVVLTITKMNFSHKSVELHTLTILWKFDNGAQSQKFISSGVLSRIFHNKSCKDISKEFLYRFCVYFF